MAWTLLKQTRRGIAQQRKTPASRYEFNSFSRMLLLL
jgi:hypothetical protein